MSLFETEEEWNVVLKEIRNYLRPFANVRSVEGTVAVDIASYTYRVEQAGLPVEKICRYTVERAKSEKKMCIENGAPKFAEVYDEFAKELLFIMEEAAKVRNISEEKITAFLNEDLSKEYENCWM